MTLDYHTTPIGSPSATAAALVVSAVLPHRHADVTSTQKIIARYIIMQRKPFISQYF